MRPAAGEVKRGVGAAATRKWPRSALGCAAVISEERRRTTLPMLCAAVVVGAIGMLLASLLTAPAGVPFAGHGEYFVAQAADPGALVGMFPQRILWPLLAHTAGLAGIGPVLFSQVCSGALLATVFWFCRVRGAQLADALLVTAAVAATGAVQLYQVMTCHSDTLNWILMLLLVHHVRRPALFWVLVFVAALSHEMIFFLSPWLLWLRRSAGADVRRDVAALAATAGLYWGWLQVVRAVGTVQGYGAGHYLENHWLVWGTLALWTLWLLLLLCEFGPLLAIVVWGARTDLWLGGRTGNVIYAACVLGMMAFAYDVQRFACYAFLPLVLASLRWLLSGGSRAVYATLLVIGIGSYAALHKIPGQAGGWPYERAWHWALVFETHAPGTRHRFFTEVLPHLWPEALAFAAFAAAIVATGLVLRRRRPPVQDEGPAGCFTIRKASP